MIDLNEAMAIMAPDGKSMETRYNQRAAINVVRVVGTSPQRIEGLPNGFGGHIVGGIGSIAAKVGDLRPPRPLCQIEQQIGSTSYRERQ